MNKEPARSGDELDWTCRKCRKQLATFNCGTGKGKTVKRALNKRFRKRGKQATWEE